MKGFKYIVIGGALLATGSYLYNINRAQYKIVIVVTGATDRVTLQGVSIIVKYNIKNPTGSTMRMTPPLIRLLINGKQLATSSMQQVEIPEASRDSGGKIIIRANKETGEIATKVMIPWLSLISVAPDLVTRFKSQDKKNKILLKVETLSMVYTLVGSFPYEQISNIKL